MTTITPKEALHNIRLQYNTHVRNYTIVDYLSMTTPITQTRVAMIINCTAPSLTDDLIKTTKHAYTCNRAKNGKRNYWESYIKPMFVNMQTIIPAHRRFVIYSNDTIIFDLTVKVCTQIDSTTEGLVVCAKVFSTYHPQSPAPSTTNRPAMKHTTSIKALFTDDHESALLRLISENEAECAANRSTIDTIMQQMAHLNSVYTEHMLYAQRLQHVRDFYDQQMRNLNRDCQSDVVDAVTGTATVSDTTNSDSAALDAAAVCDTTNSDSTTLDAEYPVIIVPDDQSSHLQQTTTTDAVLDEGVPIVDTSYAYTAPVVPYVLPYMIYTTPEQAPSPMNMMVPYYMHPSMVYYPDPYQQMHSLTPVATVPHSLADP